MPTKVFGGPFEENLHLVPRQGITGAPWATLFSYQILINPSSGLPTAWGPTAHPSPLTFLIGVVAKGPSVEDTPPLLPLRPKEAVL